MSERNVEKAQWRTDAMCGLSDASADYAEVSRRVLVLLDALTATEQELRQRELHHFETEQIIARIGALADEWAGHADLFEGERTAIDSDRAAERLRAALSLPSADQNGDDRG